jgi:hypothetical protein
MTLAERLQMRTSEVAAALGGKRGRQTSPMLSDLTLAYIDYGLRLFPVRADKTPLVDHWPEAATCSRLAIEAWRQRWPFADPAWALPATVVVVDIDVKGGKDGYRDFERLAGCDPRSVATAASSTPSGGMQLFYDAAGRLYGNRVAIGGTGLDTRSAGGYVVLPEHDNGREWLRPLLGATLLPARVWLDRALKREPAPCSVPVPVSLPDDPWIHKKALTALERACAKIVAAPCGAQDTIRHQQCFYVGGLVSRGDLSEAEAYDALLAAARQMPAHGRPWRNLETKISRSLEAGIQRPLEVSGAELVMRRLRLRMRARRPAP